MFTILHYLTDWKQMLQAFKDQVDRIPTLDGWRGIAILLVLARHGGQYGQFKNQMWTNLGSFGVDIFFVLSGYIITTRFIEEREKYSTISLSGFYLRRAFRILPLVAAYLTALCVVSRFVNLVDFRPSELVGSLFFFRNYQFAAHPGGIYTTHFWSLSIEEHFYLLWPALLLWAGNRRALWLAIAGASASSLWRAYECSGVVHIFPSARPGLHALQTDARIDGLLLGSALALLLVRASVREFIVRNFQKETPVLMLPLLFLALIWAGDYPSFMLYALVAVMLSYSLIVHEGPTYWCLKLPILRWIGTISYSLYIWQQIFLLHPNGNVLPLGRLSLFPVNLACVVAVASCSFYFIERPAIALGKRMLRQPRIRSSPLAEGALMTTVKY
jgi:peptidoglycan/LPS O-acetylase OafA/YrhL